MTHYTIYPLLTGIIKKTVTPGPHFPGVPPVTVDSPIVAYLIMGGKYPVLVDTGAPPPEVSIINHYPMVEDPAMLLPSRLAEHGLAPGDIRVVVNTHLHWDHCYYNNLFTEADIYVQAREIEFALDPLPNHYLFYDAAEIGLKPAWLAARDRFKVINGDHHLMDGLELVFLPGHTPGFMGLLAETAKGPHLIAGDCIPALSHWRNREYGLPTPSGIHVDLADYYSSLRRILEMNAAIIAGHDFASLAPSYPSPE